MRFISTPLAGAFVIEIEPAADERGFFARSFCRREMEAHGLDPEIVQCNISHNLKRGTLRGLHYQAAPRQEAKVVSCIQGEIVDVIVDLRDASSTRGRWFSVSLSASQHNHLYVPKGFAHGFQTVTDGATVFYQMSEFYAPDAARGIRWDDPGLAIEWPLPDPILSARDRGFPLLSW
jgi:dTDP-4-dehydrorhamnose 3,5-epimerase